MYLNERVFKIKVIEFTPDNPYSKYFTHGKLNSSETSIGFYNGDVYHTAEPYDRYLTSVSVGRLLTLAEYDAIVLNKKTTLSPMQTILKQKQFTWKKLGVFKYHYSKITIKSREDELEYMVIEYNKRTKETKTHLFDNLSLVKKSFENGVSNIIFYTSFTDLSCYMQQN